MKTISLSEEHKRNISKGCKDYAKNKGINGSICNGYREFRERDNGIIKRQYEHRMVMEKYIGRKLKKEEHIHHINGNRIDNRIENLEIINNKEHLRMHAKKNGLGKNRIGVEPGNKLDIVKVDKIIDLYEDGNKMWNISKKIGISPTTVKKYLLLNNII